VSFISSPAYTTSQAGLLEHTMASNSALFSHL